MKRTQKDIGTRGEEIALHHLKKQGYHIIARNYRCTLGEIDIIARENDDLVFVEVKTRTSKGFGSPEEAVYGKKQRKIIQVALYYMNETYLDGCNVRFDVVAITAEREGTVVNLIRNAFDLTE